MKNKITNKLMILAASIFTLLAMSTAVSACYYFWYQPEEPKCLREM